ncbi:MAG TPA: AlkA N-terminal domain-containing protein [Gemmatimonadales bacterium]|nr:AlkA N-terminal domain-containing protein [Gemmatimonadales bacterium]
MVSAPPLVPPAPSVHREAYALAVDARDPRFDGVFFVAITTTRVYCRPVCPSRLAYDRHRRFFDSAAAAERAGFRPCLRCRPELAPGRAVLGAVSRLAQAAAQRIAGGALNGRSVAELARELGVSERHVRRALEREVGVPPLELAQTHRLLLARRLLVDTDLSVTRVAYASGFQSLRRFNAAFREQYGMAPSVLRRGGGARRAASPSLRGEEALRLTLAYRAPFAWDALLAFLRGDATPGVEVAGGRRYGRTVQIDGCRGFVWVEDAPPAPPPPPASPAPPPAGRHNVAVQVSASLVPVLMPLIAGLRRFLDLDAEPAVVDGHLAQGGLGALVARRPGVRIPGAFNGFEVALRALLGARGRWGGAPRALAGRVAAALGEPLETGVPGLTHLAPTAARVAEAGAARLSGVGVPPRRAESITAVARAVAAGALRLEPGSGLAATHRALLEIDGISERLAMVIVMRALYWPDAFPATDRALQRSAGVKSAGALLARAEEWRPWRAYAALHLWLQDLQSR